MSELFCCADVEYLFFQNTKIKNGSLIKNRSFFDRISCYHQPKEVIAFVSVRVQFVHVSRDLYANNLICISRFYVFHHRIPIWLRGTPSRNKFLASFAATRLFNKSFQESWLLR